MPEITKAVSFTRKGLMPTVASRCAFCRAPPSARPKREFESRNEKPIARMRST